MRIWLQRRRASGGQFGCGEPRVTPTKSQGCALLKKPEARRSGEAERDLTGERGGDCGLIGRADVPCRMGQELGTRNTYAIGRREGGPEPDDGSFLGRFVGERHGPWDRRRCWCVMAGINGTRKSQLKKVEDAS